ncbi:MAG: SAM-dependent methyltransferase [Flavobacteriales bacterium]|nr:MAG: SAM-dependent methyltransferase [Flavobacteriales bacterium]
MGENDDHLYWTQRYRDGNIGWNIGFPSTPIKKYIDQLSDKAISILMPGAGNAYEAEYLWKKGFHNIDVLDISELPLDSFRQRNPGFPKAQLLTNDFFLHQGQYDLILEQTFFCSLLPTDQNRFAYAEKMAHLLRPEGKLAGVWFDFPLTGDLNKRPFGGDKALYLKYLDPYFSAKTFERCYNSIPPRQGNELFGIFEKKALERQI